MKQIAIILSMIIMIEAQNESTLATIASLSLNSSDVYGHVTTVIIDLDKDGDDDILAAEKYATDGTKLFLLENRGNHQYTTHLVHEKIGASTIACADLDNDNDIDIVTTLRTGEWHNGRFHFGLLLNDGSRDFVPKTLHGDVTTENFRSLEIKDMDKDNDLDIIGSYYNSMNISASHVFILYNDGTANFTVDTLAKIQNRCFFEIVDWEKDGDNDILGIFSIGTAWKDIFLFKNEGSQQFTLEKLYEKITYGSMGYFPQINSAVVFDADNDGDIDLLLKEYSKDILIICENRNGQYLVRDTNHTIPLGDLRLCDIDHNGFIDIYSSSVGGNYAPLPWLKNHGGLRFEENSTKILGATLDNHSLLHHDYDNDGDFDFLQSVRVFTGSPSLAKLNWVSSDLTPEIIKPKGGDYIVIGKVNEVKWSGSYEGTVSLSFSKDSGKNWLPLVTDTTNNGRILWKPEPSDASKKALIRIFDSRTEILNGMSDSVFSVVNGYIVYGSPKSETMHRMGNVCRINWESIGTVPFVKIEYSLDGGINWHMVAANHENTNTYNWVLDAIDTSQTAKLRISEASDSMVYDQTPGTFYILPSLGNGIRNISYQNIKILRKNQNGNSGFIKLYLTQSSEIELVIYNARGGEVGKNIYKNRLKGYNKLEWNAKGKMNCGIYFFRMCINNRTNLEYFINVNY